MALFKCKMCGGDLEVTPGVTVAECEFCGTKQTLPKTNEEVIQNLFNRANVLRLKCEFDKAEQIYEKILHENDTEAEAHWGIVLCKYGIEYVEDPKTYTRIPTCHRTSYDAVITDADYQAAIEHADATQRGIYEAEAKTIDEIQKNILNIVKNEQPFDVFLCYKETDDYGNRTVDSAVANDIYYQLTQEGLKVFYAAITLEDKLGQEYEPYIFAALNSAKVMLVIGTKPQYFTSVWVKNEWSRFLKLMKTDRSRLLIPCYREMDAYELPEEFSHLQAQNMSKIGFINDVVRGIKKITIKDEPKPAVVKETIVSTGNTNVTPLLERAFMFLEDGDWTAADEYCEKVLDSDPKNAQAYLGKLMAELRVHLQAQLKDQAQPFNDRGNYQKAIRFGGEALKAALAGYTDHIVARNEQTRLEEAYREATLKMTRASTEREYVQTATEFAQISAYRDAAEKAQQCRELAEDARKDAILSSGKSQMQENTIVGFTQAIQALNQIPGWKDADRQIDICQRIIEDIKAKAEAERLENERRAEIARKEIARIKKRNKKIAIIIASIFCAAIVFLIIWRAVIIPNGKYNDAIALMDAGKYTEAISVFKALDGHKDSANKITECNTAILDGKYNDAVALMDAGNLDEAYSAFVELGDYKDAADKVGDIRLQKTKNQFKNIQVGDYITLGAYEQDNNTSNGEEGVEWLVLEVKDGKALVISKYSLECKPYHGSYAGVTWETCTLRKWLNNDFIDAAFSADEKAMISAITVSADKNPDYSTNPGKATQDQVFLLSITEANKYFSSNSARQCEPTDYAVAKGAWKNDSGNYRWWLRTPGRFQQRCTTVLSDGNVTTSGYAVNIGNIPVRPALWIDLNQLS